jgi:hypothetical protein
MVHSVKLVWDRFDMATGAKQASIVFFCRFVHTTIYGVTRYTYSGHIW